MTFWEIMLLFEMGMSVAASIALNTFWMLLIIKQISRMITRQGGTEDIEETKEKEKEEGESAHLLDIEEGKNNEEGKTANNAVPTAS